MAFQISMVETSEQTHWVVISLSYGRVNDDDGTRLAAKRFERLTRREPLEMPKTRHLLAKNGERLTSAGGTVELLSVTFHSDCQLTLHMCERVRYVRPAFR
jgi:hypothetical protein